MTYFDRCLLAVAIGAGLAACSRHDASAKTSTASASADGSVAPAIAAATAPHDTTTDRADRGRIAGDTSAKVWVIMVSDFQCPFCKQWHDAAFAALMRDYVAKGKIRLAFINMPLNIHPNAIPAAEAAMCASVQNKFWPIHDALFAAQDTWAPLPNPSSRLEAIAASVPGIDLAAWKTCIAKHATLPLIEADHDRGRGAGVGSTPSFVVNGKLLTKPDGSSPGAAADVAGAIEAALKTQR